MIDIQDLITSIEQVFIDQDKYYFDDYIPEFMHEGKFLGDYYNRIMVEPRVGKPPIFYHTLSPFDVISNKSITRALVFESAKCLLDVDFTDYLAMRTGVMSAIILKAIGVKNLKSKKVLLIGVGSVARHALSALKRTFNDLDQVECISRSGSLGEITKYGQQLGIDISTGNLDNLSEYDFIFCHTNTDKVILTKEHKDHIKPGAVIASFLSSTEHGEVDDSYFDASKANIICDWERTSGTVKDLGRALKNKQLTQGEILLLKDLLIGAKKIDSRKAYTIYRSGGTSIQNLAVLKLLT